MVAWFHTRVLNVRLDVSKLNDSNKQIQKAINRATVDQLNRTSRHTIKIIKKETKERSGIQTQNFERFFRRKIATLDQPIPKEIIEIVDDEISMIKLPYHVKQQHVIGSRRRRMYPHLYVRKPNPDRMELTGGFIAKMKSGHMAIFKRLSYISASRQDRKGVKLAEPLDKLMFDRFNNELIYPYLEHYKSYASQHFKQHIDSRINFYLSKVKFKT